MPVSIHAPETTPASPFSFGLRSLFVFVAACAILSALYSHIGLAVLVLLCVPPVVVLAVTWIIDSCMAIREMFFASTRTRSTGDIEEGIKSYDCVQTQERLVQNLRSLEQIAQDRYNAGT